ncbi:MAG TPA: class I SAM-dependent methyltransferase [Chitinophagaceae bacterium]|nr:class I SAM-dependent methyltransferase [Chitinophagaceae bacterium]
MIATTEQEAYNTLHAIRHAGKFNGWMFDAIRPFIRGRVLEAGSGIGNISSFLLQSYGEVWLSDYNEYYRELLGSKFAGFPHLKGVLPIDLAAEQLDEACAPFFGTFDTIVATNVIEHIRDDEQAIRNCRKLLKPGGRLVILVPAWQGLFNGLDRAFGHYRRYTKQGMVSVLGRQMNVVYSRYFNIAGIAGWFFTGAILRKGTIPKAEMKIFDALVPLFKVIDRLAGNTIGLSVIVVAEETGKSGLSHRSRV